MIIEFNKQRYNLHQIAQYQSIPYEAGLCCSHCSNFVRGYKGWMQEMKSDEVVGYCIDSDGSYQIVLECKYCHEKYRFHMDKHWYREGDKIIFDVEHWKREIGLHLFMYHHYYLKIEDE